MNAQRRQGTILTLDQLQVMSRQRETRQLIEKAGLTLWT